MGLERLGLITVVNNRTLCVWIIRGGCKPNDVVKRITFMPCVCWGGRAYGVGEVGIDYRCQ